MNTQEILNELWAVHFAFMRMGFKPEELEYNARIMIDGKPKVGVALKTQGKVLGIPVDKSNDPAIADKLAAFLKELSSDPERRNTIWNTSKALKRFAKLKQLVKDQGIVLPSKRRPKSMGGV